MLAENRVVLTGDHEIFRAVAGVHSAGTREHQHFVCAKCSTSPLVDVLEGDPFKRWKEELHDTDLLPNVPVDFRGECPLHATRILVSQLLNNTCVTVRDTGASTRLVMDAKNSLGLSSKWSEGDNLEHTEARDLICNKQLWSRFLRSWVTDDTVELLTSKTKKQKVACTFN